MKVARAAYGTPTHKKTFNALLVSALLAAMVIAVPPANRACTRAARTPPARLAPQAVLRPQGAPRRPAGRLAAAAAWPRSSRVRQPTASRIRAAPAAAARVQPDAL